MKLGSRIDCCFSAEKEPGCVSCGYTTAADGYLPAFAVFTIGFGIKPICGATAVSLKLATVLTFIVKPTLKISLTRFIGGWPVGTGFRQVVTFFLASQEGNSQEYQQMTFHCYGLVIYRA
jgi:hypothetical protein